MSTGQPTAGDGTGDESAHHTADRLADLVVSTVEDLVGRHFPDWRIPGTFGGHPVEPDVAADLVFTLGHLHDLGVAEVAGTPVPDAITRVLRRIDGRRTHTFFSYRVAETLLRFGGFAGNPLMAGWADDERDNIARAVDSSDWVELLDLGLPRNYAAVLARCELGRRELGLAGDANVPTPVLDDLLARTRSLLAANPRHVLDDSTHHVGRYDIYSADVWLFTEPLAPLLGDLWWSGVAAALDLVERVAAPDGTAVPWGRSSGALGIALTVELAALVLAEHPAHPGWTERPQWWRRRAATATTAMGSWFEAGLITAHSHRSPYAYRGPFRRLQMTLDVLGKLAWSAGRLRSPAAQAVGADGSDPSGRDELIRFDDDRAAAVWTHDDGAATGFVVPFVGATRSDYLAAPRRPGLYEVPVDSAIACWVPLVAARHRTWTAAGVPEAVDWSPAAVTARWNGLLPTGDLDPEAGTERLPGECHLSYAAEGRSLTLEVDLTLERPPDAVSIVVPEANARPLRLEVSGAGAAEAHTDLVDTGGLAEWRSYYGELPAVHQVDLDPGTRHQLAVRVTPTIRVASTNHAHHYDRSLYGPLEADRRAVSLASPLGPFADGSTSVADIDLFHLHWPEWLAFDDLGAHRRIVTELAAHRVPVVWTAHNLTPHDKRPEVYDAIYQLWADTAAAVIHHSAWGEARMRARYGFAQHSRHVVVPHGHFGDLYPTASVGRAEAESRLGLPPAPIRVGVLGAPRAERDVVGFLLGVTRSTATRVQVCCWSLGPQQSAPGDDRIAVAEPYTVVDADTYGLRLAACDLLALPFDPDGEMLGTGVAADVLGCGLGALVSGWGYLAEALGPAGIPMGHDEDSVAAAIDSLTERSVEAARAASRARRGEVPWEAAADRTFALFDSLLR